MPTTQFVRFILLSMKMANNRNYRFLIDIPKVRESIIALHFFCSVSRKNAVFHVQIYDLADYLFIFRYKQLKKIHQLNDDCSWNGGM